MNTSFGPRTRGHNISPRIGDEQLQYAERYSSSARLGSRLRIAASGDFAPTYKVDLSHRIQATPLPQNRFRIIVEWPSCDMGGGNDRDEWQNPINVFEARIAGPKSHQRRNNPVLDRNGSPWNQRTG
jgi:hypothetical protein